MIVFFSVFLYCPIFAVSLVFLKPRIRDLFYVPKVPPPPLVLHRSSFPTHRPPSTDRPPPSIVCRSYFILRTPPFIVRRLSPTVYRRPSPFVDYHCRSTSIVELGRYRKCWEWREGLQLPRFARD